MFFRRYRFRWSLVLAVLLVLGGLFVYTARGIRIETDILASLPQKDPVLADAHRVIRHLPVQDRLVCDLEIRGGDAETLVAAAERFETGLTRSGLFRKVGLGEMQALGPELVDHVVGHLPLLFDERQLREEVAPRLAPERIERQLAENLDLLQGLEGIGQAELVARDPLGLRTLVLARMAQFMPTKEARFHRGQLLSNDGAHLLLTAELAGAATDTRFSRAIPPLLEALTKEMNAAYRSRGVSFVVTPVGAYRAALDNETAARRDMRMAVWLTTIGIALLLILTFPRPLIGLMALLPSTVGALCALFLCSLIFPRLSILAVSFGGAIMAFTVDLGIAYLLYLDRPFAMTGKQAAREVQSGEALAVLTTIGAFLLLTLSEFSVLAEIGVFAALGVACAYAFVHVVFPLILPVMPPAKRVRKSPLATLLDRIVPSEGSGRGRLAAAALLFGVMLCFARPVFQVDLNAMNSMSAATLAAESRVQAIWGNLTSRVYLLTEGPGQRALQDQSDALAPWLEEDERRSVIRAPFVLSDLFPGEARARRQAEAWRAFWTPERTADVARSLRRSGETLGFSPAAFAPFLDSLTAAPPAAPGVPERLAGLLGVSPGPEGRVQVTMVTPGPAYDARAFFDRYAATGLVRIFDAGLFSKRLGDVLVKLFTEVALIVALGITLVVFLFFLDWRRTLIVLAPVVFALVCTLGTLNLLGRSIDIPGVMLWVVIMGMGIDYGIYYVCAYQRCLDERDPSMRLIRLAILLAAATTLIGFGVLAIAEHAVLKSIGLTSFFGIGYSLLGALVLVPPLVRRVLKPVALPPESFPAGSPRHTARARLRYRHLAAHPRLFARFKMRLDPMFPRLAGFVGQPRRILDIGCGIAVPSVWLTELFPQARVHGIDPDEERIRVARQAIGPRGEMRTGRAPELDDLPEGADTALVLDVIHMLDEATWRRTLAVLNAKLIPGGRLILRATVPADRPFPWKRRLEELRLKLHRLAPHYRSRTAITAGIAAAGFHLETVEADGPDSEEVWFVAVKPPSDAIDAASRASQGARP